MRGPLRIAILECDTPAPRTQAKYGGYAGVFTDLLEAGAKLLAEERGEGKVGLEITKWDVVNEERYPNLEEVDGVLMTGSKYNPYENTPWLVKLVDFVQEVLAQNRVRIIGVCFGHQVLGRALGVKVDKSLQGWETSVTPMTLTETGKQLFGVEKMSLHQMHSCVVFDYPKEVEQLAYSPRCEVQGMYIKNRLITVQGHPEFTKDIVTELLESRHASGVFDDTMYEDGIKRVGDKHDGVLVGKAFIKFLLDD